MLFQSFFSQSVSVWIIGWDRGWDLRLITSRFERSLSSPSPPIFSRHESSYTHITFYHPFISLFPPFLLSAGIIFSQLVYPWATLTSITLLDFFRKKSLKTIIIIRGLRDSLKKESEERMGDLLLVTDWLTVTWFTVIRWCSSRRLSLTLFFSYLMLFFKVEPWSWEWEKKC